MAREWYLRVIALTCRRLQRFPGRWRVVSWALRQVRRHGAAIGVRRVRTAHGFLVDCDLADWIGQYVYVTGSYEEPTIALLPALVRNGDSVVDVGANIGFYTLRLAQLVGPAGRVTAFEPMPYALERIHANLQLNGASQVTVVACAASDTDAIVELFLGPPEHTSIASIAPREGARTVTVRCRPLDQALAAGGRIALLKIDAEGVEDRVLAGAQRILSDDSPAIIAEINDTTWPGELMSAGYRMFQIDWDGLREIRQGAGAASPGQFNALFLKGDVPEGIRGMVR